MKAIHIFQFMTVFLIAAIAHAENIPTTDRRDEARQFIVYDGRIVVVTNEDGNQDVDYESPLDDSPSQPQYPAYCPPDVPIAQCPRPRPSDCPSDVPLTKCCAFHSPCK